MVSTMRNGREPEGQTPAPVADRHAHLDADGEQCDQQRDLADQLEHRELAHRMQFERVEPGGAEREPDQQVDDRQAHRQPIEKPPEQGDGDQQNSDQQEPECDHRSRLSAEAFRGVKTAPTSGVGVRPGQASGQDARLQSVPV